MVYGRLYGNLILTGSPRWLVERPFLKDVEVWRGLAERQCEERGICERTENIFQIKRSTCQEQRLPFPELKSGAPDAARSIGRYTKNKEQEVPKTIETPANDTNKPKNKVKIGHAHNELLRSRETLSSAVAPSAPSRPSRSYQLQHVVWLTRNGGRTALGIDV